MRTEKRVAKSSHDARHWIEAKYPAGKTHALQLVLEQSNGVDDWSPVHPKLNQERQRVAEVPVADRHGRNEEAETERRRKGDQQQRTNQQGRERKRLVIPDHEDQENHPGQREIHERDRYGRHRQDQPREVDLADHPRSAHEPEGRASDSRGEKRPRYQASHRERRVGHSIGRKAGDSAENEGEHEDHRQRLKDSPKSSKRGLLVSHLEVASCHEPDQLPMSPHITQAKRPPAASRTDLDHGNRAAGAEGETVAAHHQASALCTASITQSTAESVSARPDGR